MKQIKRDSSKPKELKMEVKQRRVRKIYTGVMLKNSVKIVVLFKTSSQMFQKNSELQKTDYLYLWRSHR